MVLLAIAAIAGGIYIFKTRGPQLAASAITIVTDKMIKETTLTPEDKDKIRTEIRRVSDKVASGEISTEHLQKLSNSLENSPVVVLMLLEGVSAGWLESSGLNAEEKEAGKIDAERVERGAAEGKIDKDTLHGIFTSVPSDQEGHPRQPMSSDEWRTLLAIIKKAADDAQIPNEPYTLDIPAQVKKLVDEILGEGTEEKPLEKPLENTVPHS
jgi:hypothetical protein